MAAARGLLLGLLLLGPRCRVAALKDSSSGRRFSEHKLCADEECSMLMYRGEALEDFTGPDCRFVNFKKGDPVYVYYKLAGGSPEVWAGSVGRVFGYFPKDLIQVVHEYTNGELQLPTDETDFVCFDGGRDDFDSYNIDELLESWELHDSATGDWERTLEETSQHMKKPPEVSEQSDLEPEPKEANLEENESLLSENTKDLEGKSEAPKTHPHANSQMDNTHSAFDPFEEMLKEKLKMPEGENNKTINGSQGSDEQETINAYKLLKKEMTLDLKTKFGSTADALVSDDETTRLVTSLEDDFDEESDAEYYTVGKEEEENTDNLDELPLLTFTDEDVRAPAKPGVEKYSADKEETSSGVNVIEVAQPPGIKDDKNILITLGDTVVSLVTGSEEQTRVMELESSDSEEDQEDGLPVSDGRWRETLSAKDSFGSEGAGGRFVTTEASKTNADSDPEMDVDYHVKGRHGNVLESKRSLLPDESEGKKQEEIAVHGTTQSSHLSSLLSSEKGQEPLKFTADNKENALKAAILISKDALREEKPVERILEDGSNSKSVHRNAGHQMNELKMKEEPKDIVPPLDDLHQAPSSSVEEVDAVASGPGPHSLAAGHPGQDPKEEPVLQTQSLPRFSSADETGSPAELDEEVPAQEGHRFWQQEKDMAFAVHKHMDERRKLSGEAIKEIVRHQAVQDSQQVGTAGQTDSAGAPGFYADKPEADEHIPEELLEDENALSAKQSKEQSTGAQDRLDVTSPAINKAPIESTSPGTETEETKIDLELEGKRETVAKGVEDPEPASMTVGAPESPFVDEKTHRPPQGSGFPDTRNLQASEFSEVFPSRETDDGLEHDNLEEQLKALGLAEERELEGLSKEDQEELPELLDPEDQWSASEAVEDDPFHWAPPPPSEHSDGGKDLPIIRSFFKEQQSMQRFQKYFDVHELEAMFHEMSLKLKSAQQESLPYNVDKVLDKVFRASESQILSVAEKMLDMRVAEYKEQEMKENNIFEEAAALDDVQDLIYFVRYKYSTEEEPVSMVTPPPPEEDWDRPREGIPPPHEDNFQPESTEDPEIPAPEEPTHVDQPAASDTVASQESQIPSTENDSDPGVITTEGTDIDAEKRLDPNAEAPTSAPPPESTALSLDSFVFYLTHLLVATLPDDVRPGPDFYGLPWKPVLITIFLGIFSFAIFFWRTFLAVKSRVYQVSEQQISEKLKTIREENKELLEKLSKYEQKIKESKKHVQESKKQNMILSDEAVKFKDKIKELEETNEVLEERAKTLRALLHSEREQNGKNQDLIVEKKKAIEKLKDVISMNASEFSEVQIALNEAKLSEEKVKSECHRVQEENAKLKKKKEQLQQEIQDWTKSHAELSEQIVSFQRSQKDLETKLLHKDDNIDALTNCITQLNRLDCESESEDKNKGESGSDELANGEMGGDRSEKIKNQIKQMMDVSRTKTAISVVEEDLKLLQVKLRASMSTKCNLEDQIKQLEDARNSLQSTKAGLEDDCKTLKQKVEILNELYQQKEMALQKKLSQEEYERQEKEQRLSAADEKAVLAVEEVKTYKRRIEEMEEELQKTERSFKNQIATHEKKAHDNWLKARAAERAIAEEKREAANLRHKLLEITQKLAMLQEEPVIVKPMPGRPSTQNPPRRGPLSQNGSFGPSPVSGGECSPPLTADPPGRPLSATLSRRNMPRSEFGQVDGPLPRPRWPSDASGKLSASDPGPGPAPMMNSSSGSSSPKVTDEGKQTLPQEPEGASGASSPSVTEQPVAVNMAAKGPPPFPGMPLMSSPVGGPPPPPIRYGPPPQLCRPFGPRPLPPPFGPGLRPPLGLREYAPGIPPGKRDLPLDPREFLPGHTPFRPLGPREYFIPGTRLPPPPHGPQDYPPSPAARDSLPSASRDEPPLPASQSSSQDSSQSLKQSP
ncbi:transport and Golgi organization protein 1 homolog isoform X2 [Echinops telfairi]|uniref:Transport and Golgi organization protein 1 homolog isoform X2 n=1 Tax=Echinops telfairi TaxID=9371 RepID=A0ABM1VM92_ECHTE|nr:transport and Golgi organization protein 1 homolog isoform X2 [Echinops telfairi]